MNCNNILTIHKIIHGEESSSQISDTVKFESGGGAMNKAFTMKRVLGACRCIQVQGHIAALCVYILPYSYP